MKERLTDAIDGKLVLEHAGAESHKGPVAG
jgi:hypothetical protein